MELTHLFTKYVHAGTCKCPLFSVYKSRYMGLFLLTLTLNLQAVLYQFREKLFLLPYLKPSTKS